MNERDRRVHHENEMAEAENETDYQNGYHPFGWGDFWRTGMTAKAARNQGTGYRVDGGYRTTQSQIWKTTSGPRGGVWIKYEKA